MKVEIWSDVVCPWCYIGKRRYESALAAFPHRDEVEVIYRSFELDPSAQVESGQSVTERLAEKYGVSLAQAAAMNARVTSMAAGEGLEYHLEKARHANTVKAHRLIHLAASKGLQDAVLERVQGRVDDAAKLLEVPRSTLYTKLKRYGLRSSES